MPKYQANVVAALTKILGAGDKDLWFHLTDNSKFQLDESYSPEDNSFAIDDRSGRPGIYISQDVEGWFQGKGYQRPFLVEFTVDPSVKDDPGIHGRWGGEIFVPAASFKKLTLNRVIPIDAYIREKYGDYGWIESDRGEEFDTGKPIETGSWGRPLGTEHLSGYQYPGPDVRDMPSADTRRLNRQLKEFKG